MKFISSMIFLPAVYAAAVASLQEDEKVTVQSNGDRTLVYGTESDNNRNHYYEGPSHVASGEQTILFSLLHS